MTTPPYGQQPYQPYPPPWLNQQPPPPPPPRKSRRWLWIVGAAAAVTVVITAVSIAGGNTPQPTAPAAQNTTTTPKTAAAAPLLTVPDTRGMTSEQAATALAAAGFANITFEQNGAPPSARVLSQNPLPGFKQAAGNKIHLIAEPPPPVPHRAISTRDWLLIAKAPDSHVGERVIVYGKVTQFDAATGPTGFRANVDGAKQPNAYDYDTNTVLRGTTSQLSNVVQDDMFRADVTVGGSYSYETTMGGTLTAPVLNVDAITVIN